MVGIFLQDLPFDLDIACPISIPWHASVELEIPTSGSLIHADEAEEQDEVYNYLRRRYWETLYLPESLAPVESLCADLLRIRRDPSVGTSGSLGLIDGQPSNLELSDVAAGKNESRQSTAEGNYNGAKMSEIMEQEEQYLENGSLSAEKAVSKKKRKREPVDRSTEEARSPLHRLLLTIPQLERKHRQDVAAVLSRALSHHYGLSCPVKSNVPTQQNVHDPSGASLLADSKTSDYLSPLEIRILENALKIRNTSGKAEDDMTALHRTIDAEVEQWYQERRSAKSHTKLQLGSADGIALDSQRHSGQTPDAADTQAPARLLDVHAKKEELLASVMAARIKSLKEQLERREVLLQLILLLVINHLYVTVTPSVPEGEDAVDEQDAVQSEDLESEYRKRRSKKKKKKPPTSSSSAMQEAPAEMARVTRRKRRRSITTAVESDYEQASNPAVLLDLYADRVTLWQAIGVGILGEAGLKSNKATVQTSDTPNFEIASDTDDQDESSRPNLMESSMKRAVLPSARTMEEWDWIQRFCVCIVERYFLDINRKFCESFHLKVFGEALTPSGLDGDQDQVMDNYDVGSVHTVNTDASAGAGERSFSRAGSVTSVTSRSTIRLESTHSLEPSLGVNGDKHGYPSVENAFGRKPSTNNINSRDPLPRAKSNANSSQLFKNRQVGFTRTNSSYLSATPNGSVSIVMGKRKTMVVPIPANKLPRAERKVSGDATIPKKPAAMGNRRSVTGGEDSRYQSESQPSGPATLAFATPSKPRANQFVARSSAAHMYIRDAARQEPTANGQARGVMIPRNFGSSISDHSAGFVAETPALPNGRRRTMDQQALGRNTSFSVTSKAFSDNQRATESYMSAKTPFAMESMDADDLADFMVDTDDEDEPSLDNGMVGSRGLNDTLLQSRNTQVDQDVQEVPETPLKTR